jgi:hypothetical protein
MFILSKKCSDLAFLFGEFLAWWLHLYCVTFAAWTEIADHDPAEQMEGHMAQQLEGDVH